MDNSEVQHKPGIKTTEFWVTLAPVILGLIEAMKGDTQNNSLIIICATVLGALYMISRTIIKRKEKSPPRRSK